MGAWQEALNDLTEMPGYLAHAAESQGEVYFIWKSIIINSYSSRTRRIWADIYNQRGRRPSWLSSAHIRQVREE